MSISDAPLYKAHSLSHKDGPGHVAPSPAEWAELPELDGITTFRPVANIRLSDGRQSRVTVLEYSGDGQSRHVIWKRMGAGKGLTEAEASELEAELLPYRSELIDAGWRVPELFYSGVVRINGEHQVFSYEQFIPGGDGDLMIADPAVSNERKWFLTDEVVRRIASYPVQRGVVGGQEVSCLPHGLDLKHANLVLSASSNELFFVDLFGPKRLNSDGSWRTKNAKLDSLPDDSLRAVCATREGALLRFWRLARRQWYRERDHRSKISERFAARISDLGIPGPEAAFVASQIEAGCPWLDSIYERNI